MKWQVAGVKKGLGSIPKMVEGDNTVVFSKRGSYIKNERSGQVSAMRKADGVYEFVIWVQNKYDGLNPLNKQPAKQRALQAVGADYKPPFQGLEFEEF
jgi:hypothetical protein